MIIPANFGRIVKRTAVSDNYQILASDDYVVISVTGKTLTLPAASAVPPGWEVECGVTANGTVSALVARASGDTIGGAAGNITITTTTGKVGLISDGVSNWECVRAGS